MQPLPLTTLLPEEHFQPTKTISLLDEIRDAQKTEASPPGLETDPKGLLHVMDKIWVPQTIIRKILELHHSSRTAVHPRIGKTQVVVTRYWYWPTLKKDTHEYLTACDICQ